MHIKKLRDSVKPSADWKQLAMAREIHKSFKGRLVNEVFILKRLCTYFSSFFFRCGTQVTNGKALKGFVFPLYSTADAVLRKPSLPLSQDTRYLNTLSSRQVMRINRISN